MVKLSPKTLNRFLFILYGVVSQLARESDSYPGGRWFEPSPRYKTYIDIYKSIDDISAAEVIALRLKYGLGCFEIMDYSRRVIYCAQVYYIEKDFEVMVNSEDRFLHTFRSMSVF